MKTYTKSDFAGIVPLEIDDAERNVAYFLAPVSVAPFHGSDETTFAVAVQERPLTWETDGVGDRRVTGVDWNAESREYIVFNWLDAGCAFPKTLEEVNAMLDDGGAFTDYGAVAFLNPASAERIGMSHEAFAQ